MGKRLRQLATWTAYAFALICALIAAVSMVQHFSAVNESSGKRVPAVMLDVVDVSKLKLFPSGYLPLVVDDQGNLDARAAATNQAILTNLLNPPPPPQPIGAAIALCIIASVAIAVAMLKLARGQEHHRPWTTVIAVAVALVAGFTCVGCGLGPFVRATKNGGYVRQLESAEVISVDAWNQQVDLGRLPVTARASGTIAEVLYDREEGKGATRSGSRLMLAAVVLLMSTALGRIKLNIWAIADNTRAAASAESAALRKAQRRDN